MTIQVREAVIGAEPSEWLAEVGRRLTPSEQTLVARAFALASEGYADRLREDGEPLLGHWREVASILSDLHMEGESLAAGLLAGMPDVAQDWCRLVDERASPQVAALVEGVARMAQIQGMRAKVAGGSPPAERAAQLEALRKMLLAMVQDARVVLIKLADQTQALRYLAGRGEADARARAARDTLDLFAPLANRLGVWQLKWELEDLALRCSEPETYKAIARELQEKRADREAYIAEVIRRLQRELAASGIRAEVTGRPKHIYSIYSKLRRKDLTLKELFDVRGVRVLVDDVKDCYAALGLVHNLWTPLPKEFDDYIAKPKPNHYRSLHTAVVGPDGKVLEVQIRTFEMHQHNEYGVAAHWRYKEGRAAAASEAVRGRGDGQRSAASFEERIGWLRQILDWRDGLADVADLAEYFRTSLFEDTVYVLTPQGRVIDLPLAATPVDFAYHVHTDLGHRCRGARVDGEMVPLSYRLSNGQTVEILAAKSGGPSRDWLNPELGFVHSSRARAKVRQWFNSQNLEAAIGQGRQIVERVLRRAGMTALGLEKLASQLQFDKVEELLAAAGRNELTARQIQAVLQEPAPAPVAEPVPARSAPAPQPKGDILVVGVDKLLTVLARCCKPAPPDPIIGFVTRGRGVTVHRASCPNVMRLSRERLIEAQWGAQAGRGAFPVDVEVDGGAQPELMRDVLDVFAREQVRILAARSHARDARARLYFTLEISDLSRLRRLLTLVGELPGVTQARRA
jgi:GTP pyrophosphokinase